MTRRGSDAGGGDGNADDGFGVLDLACLYSLEGVGEREAFELDQLVFLEFLADVGEAGGEKNVHLFGKKAGRDVELGDEFDVLGADAYLLFELADRAGARVLTLFQRPGGDLEKLLTRGVAILTHESHTSVFKHGHDHGAHAVATWLVEEERRVDWDELSPKLGEIIGRHGDLLLRVKGVIHTKGDPRPLVIHGVQRLFHPPVRLLQWTSRPGTRIVVIGDRGAAPIVAEIRSAISAATVPRALVDAERERLTA